jgi:hypothetical protein
LPCHDRSADTTAQLHSTLSSRRGLASNLARTFRRPLVPPPVIGGRGTSTGSPFGGGGGGSVTGMSGCDGGGGISSGRISGSGVGVPVPGPPGSASRSFFKSIILLLSAAYGGRGTRKRLLVCLVPDQSIADQQTGLQSPFLLTWLVHFHAAIWHILSPSLTHLPECFVKWASLSPTTSLSSTT